MLCGTLPTSAQQADELRVFSTPEKGDPLKLHIFYPPNHDKSQPKPAIVFFFGGGWYKGKPGQFYPQCERMAQEDYVAISAQYRTKTSHEAMIDDCVADARSALRYVRTHAKELGIDPNRIIASGGSAGGTLAAGTALPKAPNNASDDTSISPRPAAIVMFNPALTLHPDRYHKPDKLKRRARNWEAIDPLGQIDKTFPPTLILFGDKDTVIIPEALAREFQQKLEQWDIPCELAIYPEAKHGFFNQQPFRDQTLEATLTFLNQQGLAPTKPTARHP